MRYYKNKFAIAVCENDEQENIIYLFDNAQEYAKHLNIKVSKARDILGKHFNGVLSDKIKIDGFVAKLEFVNMVEEL